MMAVTPVVIAASTPSANGKYASLASTEPRSVTAGLPHRNIDALHPVRLPGSDPHDRFVLGEDNGIGLDMPHGSPRKC